MEIIDTNTNENVSLQKELVRIVKKNKTKRKLITFAVVFILILLTVGAAWLSGRMQAKENAKAQIAELTTQLEEQEKKIQELIETPIVVSSVNPEIKLDMIYSEIKSISELATMEYLFTDAAEFSDSKQIKDWNIPFTEKSFILKWDGIIKAGVKLDLVNIEVNQDEKQITVSVPAAEILSYQIDTDSVEVLDEKDNIFNNISVDDKAKFDAATEEAMKQRAIENGLLEKAQSNAEDILLRLLQANPAIGNEYVIEFTTIQ